MKLYLREGESEDEEAERAERGGGPGADRPRAEVPRLSDIYEDYGPLREASCALVEEGRVERVERNLGYEPCLGNRGSACTLGRFCAIQIPLNRN